MTEKILLKDLNGNLLAELSKYKKMNIEFIEDENGCQRIVSHNGIYLSSIENKERQNLVFHFMTDSITITLQSVNDNKNIIEILGIEKNDLNDVDKMMKKLKSLKIFKEIDDNKCQMVTKHYIEAIHYILDKNYTDGYNFENVIFPLICRVYKKGTWKGDFNLKFIEEKYKEYYLLEHLKDIKKTNADIVKEAFRDTSLYFENSSEKSENENLLGFQIFKDKQ